MSYDISLKVKVEGIDKYVKVKDGSGITYNVKELVKMSSGWNIIDGENNGSAEKIGILLERGIYELATNPDLYKQYEAANGWGTVEDTLLFFRYLHEACQEYPYAYVFVE